MPTPKVSGKFDDLGLSHIQYLKDISHAGTVHVLLWSDELAMRIDGKYPKFPEPERKYFLDALRYVSETEIVNNLADADATKVPDLLQPYREPLRESDVILAPANGRKKVLVTGCFDWLHTGHVRFFEEVAAYGDVYAVVGHDANIALLKGAGHPQFCEQDRRFVVGSLKSVKQALISTGSGWLDAEPEIARIRPDIYAVNEDGDKPEKRQFCKEHGIEYLVLRRIPKGGLAARSSTQLRGY